MRGIEILREPRERLPHSIIKLHRTRKRRLEANDGDEEPVQEAHELARSSICDGRVQDGLEPVREAL